MGLYSLCKMCFYFLDTSGSEEKHVLVVYNANDSLKPRNFIPTNMFFWQNPRKKMTTKLKSFTVYESTVFSQLKPSIK